MFENFLNLIYLKIKLQTKKYYSSLSIYFCKYFVPLYHFRDTLYNILCDINYNHYFKFQVYNEFIKFQLKYIYPYSNNIYNIYNKYK